MKTKAGKKVLLTLVCAALTIALGACSGDKAGKESSQITIGIPQDLAVLTPTKQWRREPKRYCSMYSKVL